jgi:outer membrane receptor protein involved in Fe transport
MAYTRDSAGQFAGNVRSAILLVLAGAALTAPAIAQESPEGQSSAGLSEVTVTGTRLRTQNGMETPTPVTAVASQEIAALAPGNLVEAMSQMPQFLNNSGPANVGSVTGPLGSSFLNLRGIGQNRTLVLLDGRRVASSNRLGTTDIAMFPESMLKGMEVVTGGASAAYGSDAVSGVVNFLLDTDFTGVKAKLQGGMTSREDNDNVEASIAGGMALGERGHIMGSVEYYKANRVESYKDRDWYQNWGTVDVNGQNRLSVVAPDVRARTYTAGGLIRLPGSQLNMTQFLTGGTAAPFENGSIVGATRQSGGTGFYDGVASKEQDQTGQGSLFPETERGSAFLYADYDFNDDWNGYFQYLYGQNYINYTSTGAHMETEQWRGTIYADNAYLPDSVRQIMLSEGRTNGVPFYRYASKLDLARARGEQDNDLNSVTTGVKGNVGDVRINAYYQYGRSKSVYTAVDFPRLDRLYRSLDAVRNPAGQIVCRSTLTNPNDGCVPGNFFGAGTMSQEAIDYILDGDMWRKSTLQQHFAEVAADTLFFKDRDAGPISAAAGFSYREDSFRQHSGPDDLVALDVAPSASEGYRGLPTSFVDTTLLQFSGVADAPIGGRFDVWEAFAETQVPLISAKPLVKSLDLNAAVRYASYSVSGGVVAWKAGLDWRLIDSLRFRATRSRDTRAATLAERFDSSGGGATASDPVLGRTYSFSQLVGGNPDVKPELADTWTFGVVFQPTFLEGFALSVDYYDVKIKDAISQLGIQRIIDDCSNGATALCERVIRNPATGEIDTVENLYLNVAQARVSGVDAEASYRRNVEWLSDGRERITARLFTSYLGENSSSNIGAPTRDERGTTNLPKLTATGIVGYDNGPFNAMLTGRWIDSRVQFNSTTVTTANSLDNYKISSVFYLNTQVGYRFDTPNVGNFNVYLNVQNVLDKDPPVVATWSDFFGASTTTPALHDALGRRYALGVEMEF